MSDPQKSRHDDAITIFIVPYDCFNQFNIFRRGYPAPGGYPGGGVPGGFNNPYGGGGGGGPYYPGQGGAGGFGGGFN